MTLRYSMQLMDEIPMIWGCSFQIYGLFMITCKPGEKNVWLQVGLFLYCGVVTLLDIQDLNSYFIVSVSVLFSHILNTFPPEFHQSFFLLCTFTSSSFFLIY
ncbi:alkaline ceramidase 3-like [Plakobranchus ocellatus]|uniref:Alkaline ceramidase n=1 Tax=Plakobranchus ocellatus TaxID=259542 RepID=A0AAV4CVF4_9GAST|nr:alkaline ceramidase 3-like [Plakobranchus ocellatus]